jgi:hypothetical protein
MGLGEEDRGVELGNLKTHILPIQQFMQPQVLPRNTLHCIHNPKQTKQDPDLICSKSPSQCTSVHLERGECTTLPMRDRYVGDMRNVMRYRYIYCNHYYGTG